MWANIDLDHPPKLQSLLQQMKERDVFLSPTLAVFEKQLYAMVEKLISVDVNEEEIDPYLPPVLATLSGLDKEELIRRLVSLEFNRFLDYYRDARDINVKVKAKKRKTGANKAESRLSGETRRFFINVGRLDKLKEGAIVRLVCEKSGIPSSKLGRIDLKREFSFFDVEKSVAKKVVYGSFDIVK